MRTSATLLWCSLLACSGGGPVLPKAPDAAKSTVTVDKSSGVVANDTEEVQVTVTALDAEGKPAAASAVKLSLSGDGGTVVDPLGGLDLSGVARGRVRASVAETKTVTVTLTHEGRDIVLDPKPQVTFVAGPVDRAYFVIEPSNVQAGMVMAPVRVATFDRFLNPTATPVVSFSLRLVEGTPGAVLSGGAAKDTVDGGITWDMVSVDRAGTSYGMQARQVGPPGYAADSIRFNVTP